MRGAAQGVVPNGELLLLRPPHPHKRDGKIQFRGGFYKCWFFLGRMGSRTDGAEEEVYWVRFSEMDGLGFLKGGGFLNIYIGCFWVGLLWYSILGEVCEFWCGGGLASSSCL